MRDRRWRIHDGSFPLHFLSSAVFTVLFTLCMKIHIVHVHEPVSCYSIKSKVERAAAHSGNVNMKHSNSTALSSLFRRRCVHDGCFACVTLLWHFCICLCVHLCVNWSVELRERVEVRQCAFMCFRRVAL